MIQIDRLLIDQKAKDFFLTSVVMSEWPHLPVTYVSSDEAIARLRGEVTDSVSISCAKKTLLVTCNAGSFLKPMNTDPGVDDPARARAYRCEFFQGCPLDCVYCFCQQYLSCHHSVIFANPEQISFQMDLLKCSRVVTGDIADSLALGNVSILAHDYLSKLTPENCCIELRTKCALPDNWKMLNPQRFQIDWSMTTHDQWRQNEPRTASPKKRVQMAGKAGKAGFQVGIRLDPLQPDLIDESAYYELIKAVHDEMKPAKPCSFTIGSYKMTYDLLEKIRVRFQNHPLPGYEWVRCPDGKVRPYKMIRLHSYRIAYKVIRQVFPDADIHLSMEPAYILNCFNS